MDTTHRHPQHILLGITPDSAERSRKKVLTALIASLVMIGVILAEDYHVIRHTARAVAHKFKKASRPRSGPKPLAYPLPWT